MIQNVTAENWRKACEHVLQVEKNYWKSDHIQEEMIDEVRINIGDGEEDDESEGAFSVGQVNGGFYYHHLKLVKERLVTFVMSAGLTIKWMKRQKCVCA